jgi:hypothetical protein
VKFRHVNVGDVMTLAGKTAVVLAIQKPHPLHANFWMFVWYIFDDRRLSFDALSPEYDLIEGSKVSQDGLYAFRKALAEMGK